MSVVPLPFPEIDTPADRATRFAAVVLAVYLAATTWPMVLYSERSSTTGALAVHVAALLAALVVALSRRGEIRPVRDLLPLLLGPFLYVELRWLIPGLGHPHADALVLSWEHGLFGGNPSATWAPAMPWPLLSEALHLAYASYYLLVLAPPLVLYVRGRREAYAATMLALTLVYGVCFTTYVLFPVDGPRYLVGPAAAPNGPVRAFVLHLLEAGSSRGTAFPSSHVAAAVVASLCALRFQRRLGVVVAVLTVGLALGTVYGGFHYGVDALAGVLVGLSGWLAARVLWRELGLAGSQSATAA
ncbi:MAG TPA: phosphatase PAP2 family protein [Gemmatimonadaceae bacterium]|nr:phosphatase PAP2 family protein [Gemmatimonadaceae bacterium]